MINISMISNNIGLFVLVLFRIVGYIYTSPIWGRKEIQTVFKLGFGVWLAYIIMLTGRVSIVTMPTSYGQYLITSIIETVQGMLIGFLSSIIFSIFLMSGQIIDFLNGFQMGGILDINYGVKVSQTAKISHIGAILVFFVLNGHLQMIDILVNCFTINPVGQIMPMDIIYSTFTAAFAFTVLTALKIALPIILIILFTNVILGIMLKFMPQLNILAVGMPLKILIGVFSFIYLIAPFINYLDQIFFSLFDFMYNLYS